MADGVFNIAKGKVGYYATLPATNDALIVVLLKTAAAEATLKDQDDLATILSGGSVEADFTNYARKSLTSASVTVDDTNDRLDVSIANQTWTTAGGATNNSLVRALICYDGDTTGGTDSAIIPLTYHDFVATTDGTDLTLTNSGFFRAS